MKDIFNKELTYIKNPKYRENAKKLIELLPDYFYEVAASSTGKYHPEFALGEGGLVRHTKVAVKLAYELANNEVIGSSFTDDEKHGKVKEKYVRFDHPILIANYIKENKDKTTFTDSEIEFLANVISSHMGIYNTNPYSDVVLPIPHNKYQRFVHMCDFLASRKFLDVKFENNEIKE